MSPEPKAVEIRLQFLNRGALEALGISQNLTQGIGDRMLGIIEVLILRCQESADLIIDALLRSGHEAADLVEDLLLRVQKLVFLPHRAGNEPGRC